MDEYKVIDVKNWIRRIQYERFSTFSNPTYGFCVRIDVTDVVKFSKETRSSFFANFLYVITRVHNECEELRLRVLESGEVVLFDQIDPDFTVKTEDHCFNNAGFTYTRDYKTFYKLCRETVDANSKCMNTNREYNTKKYNCFYCSCLTSIDILSMVHPIKNGDEVSSSVPRIFWDKYIEEDEKYYLNLNFTVSHALVDGEDLSKAFNLVREYCKDFKKIIE